MATARNWSDDDVQIEADTELDSGSVSDASNVGSRGVAPSVESTSSRRSSKQSVRFFISEDDDDDERDSSVGSKDGSGEQDVRGVSPICTLVVSRHRSSSWGLLTERGMRAVSLALEQSSGDIRGWSMSEVFGSPQISNEEDFNPDRNRSRSLPILHSGGQLGKQMAQILKKIGDQFSDDYSNRR